MSGGPIHQSNPGDELDKALLDLRVALGVDYLHDEVYDALVRLLVAYGYVVIESVRRGLDPAKR